MCIFILNIWIWFLVLGYKVILILFFFGGNYDIIIDLNVYVFWLKSGVFLSNVSGIWVVFEDCCILLGEGVIRGRICIFFLRN